MGTPAKPATTPSLSGANSSRTDGPVGKAVASKQAMRYAAGEPGAGDFYDLQGQAAMNKTPDSKGMSPSVIAAAAAQGQGQQGLQTIPLDAPSQLPGQSVTHGSDAHPQMNTSSLILPKQQDQRQQEVNDLVARYLPDLQAATNLPGVPDSYRKFVNYLSKNSQTQNQSV